MLTGPAPSSSASTYLDLCDPFPKVVVLTQNYGAYYYHFLVENLSRLTVVLDVLLENADIKVPAAVDWLIYCLIPPTTSMSPDAYVPAEPIIEINVVTVSHNMGRQGGDNLIFGEFWSIPYLASTPHRTSNQTSRRLQLNIPDYFTCFRVGFSWFLALFQSPHSFVNTFTHA